MLEIFAPIAQRCDLTVKPAHRLPIAVIGAGSIVEVAHLPAYRRSGLDVAGITDLDLDRAREVADRHALPRVYDSSSELLADPGVAVVDIAVTPDAQRDLALAALDAGKHILCQKPLALRAVDAALIAARAQERGLVAAVNQQLRFDEGLRAAQTMLQRGWVGEPLAFSLTVNIRTDWSTWPWMAQSDRLDLWFHSIHYLDYIRGLLGEPELVYCSTARVPDQVPKGETRSVSVLNFAGGAVAVVHVFHDNSVDDPRAEFRLEGTGGVVRGTLGLLYEYPRGRVDTIELSSHVLPTDGWLPYPVTQRWIPDAFAGPMGSLLRAVTAGGAAETSAADNVKTIALVEALYVSAESGCSQRVPETPIRLTGAPMHDGHRVDEPVIH